MPSWLTDSYLWDAVLGDLHRRAGEPDVAHWHIERALASAPTEAVQSLLRRRLAPRASEITKDDERGIRASVDVRG